MDQKIKDLVERAKATAFNAANAAGKVADSASKKAGELVELTKLNFRIFDLNTDIELLLKEIGKCVYATHIGEEINADDITDRISQIDVKYEEIAKLKELMAEKKAVSKCPVCGIECDKEDTFCRGCGAAL